MFNFLQDIAIGATPPPSLSSRYLSIVASGGGGGGGAKILQKIMTPPLSVINPCPAEYLEVFFKDIFLKQYYSTTNQPISMN